MRYRIYFLEGLHPPVEIFCRSFRIEDGKRFSADNIVDILFTHTISRVCDDHGRLVYEDLFSREEP
jgi:hypothetical protein